MEIRFLILVTDALLCLRPVFLFLYIFLVTGALPRSGSSSFLLCANEDNPLWLFLVVF